MNQREYLRSQGFTVGERGRFSAEMKAALEAAPAGSFEVAAPATPKARKPRVEKSQKQANKPTPRDMPQVRDADTVWALTSVGRREVPLGFTMCTRCRLGVRYCSCSEGPRATIDTVGAVVTDKSLLLT